MILGIFVLLAFSQNRSEPRDGGDLSEASRGPDELMERAQQGDRLAQYALGERYDRGLGVPRDTEEAIRWYRAAAEQRHATAQFSLGTMYAEGEGVQQDAEEAIRWYRAAAEQGHGHAQNNLADMYSGGKGVSQDYVLAYLWFTLAASNITDNYRDTAIKNRDMVAEKMTPEQVAEALALALGWKPQSSGSQ